MFVVSIGVGVALLAGMGVGYAIGRERWQSNGTFWKQKAIEAYDELDTAQKAVEGLIEERDTLLAEVESGRPLWN